jgi:hypothetical protein
MPSIADIRKQFPQYADVSDGELVRGLHKAHYKDMPYADFLKSIDFKESVNPTDGMSGMQKFNAGAGKALYDIGQGAAQMVGRGESGQETADRRQLDKPLMNTGAGMAGNVAGNIAALAPLAVVPGANTVGGAAALGAVAGSLQPTQDAVERLWNQGMGTALGGATQWLSSTGAQKLGEWGAGKVKDANVRASQNSVRDTTLAEGNQAGYVVPPSAVNKPSFIGGRMESLGGKAALGQEASLRNQQVTDDLARKAAGLGPDEAVSIPALKAARQRMSAPYQEVSSMSPQAAADLEILKAQKLESKLQWQHYNRQGDPNAYKAAVAADQAADAALNRIEQAAQSLGKPDLVQRLKQSRVDIARNHEVRNAVNAGSGDVDASVIGRGFDRTPERYSGELKTIGAFQQAFPHFTREGSKVPAPGVGKTELLASALLAGGGGMATGDPLGMLAGLAPFASGPARSALLSKAVQSSIAKPNYQPSLTARSAAALNDPETQRRIALMTRALALPAMAQE